MRQSFFENSRNPQLNLNKEFDQSIARTAALKKQQSSAKNDIPTKIINRIESENEMAVKEEAKRRWETWNNNKISIKDIGKKLSEKSETEETKLAAMPNQAVAKEAPIDNKSDRLTEEEINELYEKDKDPMSDIDPGYYHRHRHDE